MKLARYGRAGKEKPALVDGNGKLRDLSEVVSDIDADVLGPRSLARLAKLKPESLPAVRGAPRIGPCIARVGNFIAVGLNYADHAAESGMPVPKEPVLFNKAPSCVVGPNDDVMIPKGSKKTDWEVELAIVIGRTARYLETDEEALAHVAGYAVAHDVSEREFQIERGGTWDKGKNCETFNPLGPWLVTADEVPDPQDLGLKLWVNGELKQDGHTSDQIFPVAEVVRYVSRFMTLYPGDVINTGTPAGVAMGQPEPKPYLRPGDVVELEVEGLGRQRQELKGA
jgi:2-keto-4-pentenoate hydratase/2-oxohepta-3-ene-1,7-dioic acid hydratase in catechol pathway